MATIHRKAPTADTADALWNAIEDALLSGSIDASAVLNSMTAGGKVPVRRKTNAKLRNQYRKVEGFDVALDGVAVLRNAAQSAMPESAQMPLPLAARNGNGVHRFA